MSFNSSNRHHRFHHYCYCYYYRGLRYGHRFSQGFTTFQTVPASRFTVTRTSAKIVLDELTKRRREFPSLAPIYGWQTVALCMLISPLCPASTAEIRVDATKMEGLGSQLTRLTRRTETSPSFRKLGIEQCYSDPRVINGYSP